MQRTLSPIARLCAAAIALVAIIALTALWRDLTTRLGLSGIDALWDMAGDFAPLTAALVAITFSGLASGATPKPVRDTALLFALLLGTALHVALLAGARPLDGFGIVANLGLHLVLPVLVLLWWLIVTAKSDLWIGDVPLLLAWPALYLSYALTRGGMEARFAYPFLDALALGWPRVLTTLAQFSAIAVVGAIALVILARLLARAMDD